VSESVRAFSPGARMCCNQRRSQLAVSEGKPEASLYIAESRAEENLAKLQEYHRPRCRPKHRLGHLERRTRMLGGTILVEHDVEQRTANLQPIVVVDKAQLSKPIHKEVNSRSSRTDPFPPKFLGLPSELPFPISLPFQSGQAAKEPGQPLLRRVQELINQVLSRAE
jgi:hypothetical protein